ncbi:MAG TPA: hypothetical protein VJX10_20555 [Pseudonocardiaceae bacterium]|nr:hypothetical protein [Pseudonocardiaceae bacterium]
MLTDLWLRGPIDADWCLTRTGCRCVLVMMPTMTSGTRLLDLVPLLAGDHRVQLVFTVPETTHTWHGLHEFVRRDGRFVVPWHQAVHHRFDLVLAASHVELERIRGPILTVPHGATNLISRKYSRRSPDARPHIGLARETLVRNGVVVPTVIGLTHDDELAVLRRSCPEAVPRAVVAGDICYDRMAASAPLRAGYRQALGVTGDERLVMVSSTWTPESTFGRHVDLCRRLIDELPASHRVALVLHPRVWAAHGRGQIHSWLAGEIRDGLLLMPPEEGWRATAIASDVVIGDHGSSTQYAAAIGRPIVLAAYPDGAVRPGSLADTVAAGVPRLDPGRPLPGQLEAAVPHGPRIRACLTSRPGQAAAILRRAMYRLLAIDEPPAPPAIPALPPPTPIRSGTDHGLLRHD